MYLHTYNIIYFEARRAQRSKNYTCVDSVQHRRWRDTRTAIKRYHVEKRQCWIRYHVIKKIHIKKFGALYNYLPTIRATASLSSSAWSRATAATASIDGLLPLCVLPAAGSMAFHATQNATGPMSPNSAKRASPTCFFLTQRVCRLHWSCQFGENLTPVVATV